MQASKGRHADLLVAHATARSASRGAASLHPRPREALPRQLQHCMHELLTVNERYHQLLQREHRQAAALEAATDETSRLRAALEASVREAQTAKRESEQLHAELTSLRSAQQLQSEHSDAVEGRANELERELHRCTGELLELRQELVSARETIKATEQRAAEQFRQGYEQAAKEQAVQHSRELRRVLQREQERSQQAFEMGREQRSSELSGALLREQAQRRLLLHRAEEARHQQLALEEQLSVEREARAEAQERQMVLEQRLKGVRGAKHSLNSQLEAARAAHAHDLNHFQEMEEALGVACKEYVELASRSAQEAPGSPPPSRQEDSLRFTAQLERSPPEAMRSQVPQPACAH